MISITIGFPIEIHEISKNYENKMLWHRIEIFETSVINARTCWYDLETHENDINGTSLRILDAVRGLTVLYRSGKSLIS